jgi:hypothetical protein
MAPHAEARGRGEDPASPRNIEAAERRARALELKKAGATYDQIATQLGYSDKSGAYRAVQNALSEITAEPAKAVLRLELERLDAMLLALWPKARKGDGAAIDRVLRIQERRTRYLGLDSPQRISVEAQKLGDEILALIDQAMAEPEPETTP